MTRNDISLFFTWESRGDKWSEAPPWWHIWTEDVILVGTELTPSVLKSISSHVLCDNYYWFLSSSFVSKSSAEFVWFSILWCLILYMWGLSPLSLKSKHQILSDFTEKFRISLFVVWLLTMDIVTSELFGWSQHYIYQMAKWWDFGYFWWNPSLTKWCRN